MLIKVHLDLLMYYKCWTVGQSLRTSPAGLVLEFEIWRMISFIDDHFGPPCRVWEVKHHTASTHFGTLTQRLVHPSACQFCLPKIYQEMSSVMTFSLHSVSISRILEPSPQGLISIDLINSHFHSPSIAFSSLGS